MTIDERVAHLQEAAMEEARAKANAIVKQHEQTLTNVLNQHKGEANRQSDVRIKAETVSARQQQNMAVSKAQLELKREYGKRQKELKQELFALRFRHAVNQLENTARLNAVKKDIARVKTVLREQATK